MKKTILLIGARGSIGGHALNAFLGDYNVIAIDKKLPNRKDSGLLAIPCDVGDSIRFRRAVSNGLRQFKRIDIVLNCAGAYYFGDVLKCNDKKIKDVVESNLSTSILITRELIKIFKKQRGGHFVWMGSIAGETSLKGNLVYGPTKAALSALSEAINFEYAGLNIFSTLLVLGGVESGIIKKKFRTKNVIEIDDLLALLGKLLERPSSLRVDQIKVLPLKGVN